MAVGTLVVPVLVNAAPVHGVAGLGALFGEEMKPALASIRLGAAVPADAKRLLASIWQADQILLQRGDADHMSYRCGEGLTIGAFGADADFLFVLAETRCAFSEAVGAVINRAKDGFRRCGLQGDGML